MIIDRIRMTTVEIPLRRQFRTSFGSVPIKMAVITEVYTADGLRGVGEASTLPSAVYTEETVRSVYYSSVHDLAPRLLGRKLDTPDRLMEHLAPVRGNRCAKTGLETACWDLFSQSRGEPLASILGGTRTQIEVGDSVGITDSLEELKAVVDARLAEGYRRIKLKIEPGFDLEVVEAIRSAHPDVTLTVDANSAYSAADFPLFQALDELDLAMIEQPLAYDDLLAHAELQARIRTRICLDESIRSIGDMRLALHLGSCGVVNIKTGRVGGLSEGRRIHDLCQAHGIPVWMGGLFETSIGRYFNIALASLPNFSEAADMSPPSLYFDTDLVHNSIEVVDGLVDVPTRVGAGFDVDDDKLRFYAVDSTELCSVSPTPS